MSAAEHHPFTETDRIALRTAADDIAFAVAIGLDPRQEDLEKFRRLHRKRDLHYGDEPTFEEPS